MKFNAYASQAPKSLLEAFSYEPRELAPEDVEIKISHCGICYSDIHLIDDDWKRSHYPFVPGHEIIGTITAMGSGVKNLKPGQRVGVGWQRSSCQECDFCKEGNQNLCLTQKAICVENHGGFSDFIRTDSRFVFAIPENLASENTAPLLCGGATVYSPISRFKINSKSKVGVVGIGGLGHIALLFLKAIGCEVTAFSSSESKRDEILKMGASNVVSSIQPREVLKQGGKFDLLLSTVHAKIDWISYMQTIRPNGTLCLVGAPPGLISIPPVLLITAQRTVCGSDIASPSAITEMLEFASKHQIKPQIETAPMSQANEGIARLRANQVRYRMVLKND
jgi:uncharacterized zinc-type alcohol dehydrogenase-like protein